MSAPLERAGGQLTCYDVLSEFDPAIRSALPPGRRYWLLGGVVSGALRHQATVIDQLSQTVLAAQDSAEPLLRPNGTRRDLDILVEGVLPGDDAEQVKGAVSQAVGGQLEVSVFGFDKFQPRLGPVGRQIRNLGDWVSRRTVDEAGALRYELFPLARTVDPESYDPWQLLLPTGQQISVLHPAAHTLAYRMRSVSGVRAKDRRKVDAMSELVLPRFREQVNDGALKGWKEFAADIALLPFYPLRAHPSYHPASRPGDLTILRRKATMLRWLEAHERIVDFAQGEAMQRVLNVFVRAK